MGLYSQLHLLSCFTIVKEIFFIFIDCGMHTIGLIGSPNAGKSTLFNRLIKTYRAIITDIAGTTRDIIGHETLMDGIGLVQVLDSPGLDVNEDELPYIQRIVDEAEVIVMVIDYKVGLNSKDEEMIAMVRRAGKMGQLIVFVNKLDKKPDENQLALIASEYAHLGVEHMIFGSAHHGKTGNLDHILYQLLGSKEQALADQEEEVLEEEFLDEVIDDEDDALMLDTQENHYVQAGKIPIAIIGRPNVGKSTFINRISKKQLSKVSEIPGTTLDYISSELTIKGQDYVVYDTAGIRRKGSIHGLEKIAYDKTYGMLKYYQPIVLFLIDGDEGVTKTDRALMTHILDLHLPTLVVINKLDLLSEVQKEKLLTAVREHFGHQDRLFTVGISASTGEGIAKIRPIVNDLWKRSHVTLTTGQLNKMISRGFLEKPPTFPHNKAVKVYYTTQVKTYPPVFMSFINKKTNLTQAFKNWLETIVRQAGGYEGIPLHFLFKDKKMDEEGYAKHLEKRKQAIKARLRRTPAERIAARKAREEKKKK